MSRLLRLIAITALVSSGLMTVVAPSALAAPGDTVVSVTFDDGLADQVAAASVLDAAGMDGTFYINSGRIGSSSTYMTRANLDTLAANGHEVAGHTVSHLNLSALTPDGQRAQICNDRNTLMGWGFSAKNFAYPFGAHNSDTIAIVQECGYNSARGVGGIVSQNACNGCPYADTIPPGNQWVIRTPDSIKADTTLNSLKGYVTQAETHGGGWVPLVFHHVCANACDPNSISPANFQSFITWLAARPSTTIVKTVDGVIGGQLNPAPPVTPPGPGTGELQNPGLEVDSNANNIPDCWQQAGFGTNTGTFTRTSDAHSGSWAERIDISSYTDGAKRLVVLQDGGACSPAISAGDTATISVWYKSTATVRFSVFYRDSTDTWRSWNTSPSFPAAAAYTQATYTTPALPSGAIGISWGLNLQAVGSLTSDDYAMTVPIRDTVSPVVALLAPAEGATLSGAVSLSADADDETAVAKVDFLVNGTVVATDFSSPYSLTWDSATVANGSAIVQARATDSSGNTGLSDSHTVTVANQAQAWGVQNPSLEIDANSNAVPDCWQTSGSGTNTVAYSRVADAHTGSFAEKVDITAYTSGARRLIPTLDTGACAIAVVPGQAYTLSAWVKGTGTIRMTAFLRDGTTGWPTTTINGPTSAAPANYTLLTWTTAAMPAGTTHISFGVTLQTLGSLTVDDFAISGTPPPDTTPPTVSLTAPASGATVAGNVTLSATASDNVGVASVEFLVNGTVIGTDSMSPYSVTWDSSGTTNGSVSITARATDTSSNATTSAARSVTVNNTASDITPPTVAITSPASGATLTGSAVTISADATDNVAVSSVEFFVGATSVGVDTTAPYAVTWDSTTVLDGNVSITAKATDTSALTTTSAARTVKVDNTGPSVSVTAPSAGAAVSGSSVTVSASASDVSGVASVEFFVGAVSIGVDSSGPFSVTWDSTSASEGGVSITALATDTLGHSTASAARVVTVDNTAPTVTISNPTDGTSVNGSVNIVATVTDASAVVVEFLVNGVVINTDSVGPSYDTAWNTTLEPDGPASLTARATDAAGHVTTSSAISVTVQNATPDSTPPTASLTAPTSGATLTGAVTLSANANDDIAVAKVEFFVGTTLVGTDTTSPYSIAWDSTSAPNGPVSITAKATDTSANEATSTAVSAAVQNADTSLPTVSLTAPAADATISGTAVTISASATDNIGVAKVEFFVGATIVGTDATEPYSITWNSASAPDGPVSITAKATDTSGNAITSAARSATVKNTGPAVALTAPDDGATVSGKSVTISATATDSVPITKVEFFAGATLIATDTSAPYSIKWMSTTVADGAYVLTAKATDNLDLVTTSAGRTVTVRNDTTSPTVSLSAPAAGATVSGSSVSISASASDNIGVAKVEFFVGAALVGTDTTSPYSIAWDSTSVGDGNVSLTAQATDVNANVATSAARTITVHNAPVATTISNAGLETDANSDGTPDCWSAGGGGNNTATYARVGDAHSGSFAERITVTGYRNGSRSLESVKDSGSCAMAITAGRSYTLGLWYKSDAAVAITVSYRNSSGSWVSWATSSTSAASAAYTQKTFTTGAVPAGATHLSFGIRVSANAVVTVDDHSITIVP